MLLRQMLNLSVFILHYADVDRWQTKNTFTFESKIIMFTDKSTQPEIYGWMAKISSVDIVELVAKHFFNSQPLFRGKSL